MAFKVSGYVTEQGVPAEYHIIAQVTTNKINRSGTIEVNAYYVSEYRDENNEPVIQPLKRLWYDIRPNTHDLYFTDEVISQNGWIGNYEASYHWLKDNVDIYSTAEKI